MEGDGETEARGHLLCLWQSYKSWFPENVCIVQEGNQPRQGGSEDKESSSRYFKSWLHWRQRQQCQSSWRDHTCENWPVKNGFWLKWSDLIFGLFSSPWGDKWMTVAAWLSCYFPGWLRVVGPYESKCRSRSQEMRQDGEQELKPLYHEGSRQSKAQKDLTWLWTGT